MCFTLKSVCCWSTVCCICWFVTCCCFVLNEDQLSMSVRVLSLSLSSLLSLLSLLQATYFHGRNKRKNNLSLYDENISVLIELNSTEVTCVVMKHLSPAKPMQQQQQQQQQHKREQEHHHARDQQQMSRHLFTIWVHSCSRRLPKNV